MTANRLAVLDLPEPNAMRAPNEAPGLAALEIAIDEMAEKLGMDPVEFRIVNDTQVVPDNPAKPASADPQSKAAATDEARSASAVFAAAAGRVPAPGRAALRLGQAQRAARPRARRALARRHGRGRGHSRQPGDEVRRRACASTGAAW